ncbi:hypothetical protein CBG25_20535 [Arsenophonus sp. ENCA]|uniref:plasmid replication initiator TrfA n=1 Tax=Arsenophonus sp. ENCA TaxID=1987579 RepID=UPI000BDC12EA|nr:plasmid replication initiator TrfA [Arsenophonus sp. ENCA]PAU99117.1 hypothetical protein CBG25_20535 [Arsenophonus sp. ENCA]
MKNILDRFNALAEKHKKAPQHSEKKIDYKELISTSESIDNLSEEHTYLPVSKKIQTPIPNVILRSALFGVVEKGGRKFQKNAIKATFNGYTVKYTGEQLDQADLDVWLECISRCKDTPLGHTVRFSSYEFLKAIKRNTGKSQYDWLHDSLNRMQSSGIHLSDGKYTYIGSLINEIYREEETGKNCISLNPKIISCFGDSSWTGIAKDLRLKLKTKPLTQWLYSFFSSHVKPLPIKIETLKKLCGSEIAELRMFRFKIRKSLKELSSVTGWSCEIDEKDKVIVNKK